MVKVFSVDWLAQSNHNTNPKEGPVDTIPTYCRPHVPCMVQPQPPTFYNKVYLQPKPKTTRVELTDSTEEPQNLESRLSSPLHPITCSSPSRKYNLLYDTIITIIKHIFYIINNGCFIEVYSLTMVSQFQKPAGTPRGMTVRRSPRNVPLWKRRARERKTVANDVCVLGSHRSR